MCLVITFNSHHYDMTSIKHYVGQSTNAFIYDIANMQHCVNESFMGVWTSSVQNRFI